VVGLALLAAAAVLLLAGAELFTDHAAAAGRRLGVTALAMGLLVAGAEPEELVTAVAAAARDRPGIAAGDAIGVNVTILTLALGLVALTGGAPVGGRVRRYAVGAVVLGAAAFVAVADGIVGRGEAAALVAGYAAFVAVVWRTEAEPPALGEATALADRTDRRGDEADDTVRRGWVPPLVLVVVGVAVMAAGGVVAVAGANRVVDALDATDEAVGLTLVALATSAELLALAWAARRRAAPELAVAGMVGSVVYNATATLGGAAITRPLHIDGGAVAGAAAAAAVLPLVAVVLGGRTGRIGRPGGAVLVLGYGVFAAVTLAG
jgi:cation:H+ antiporter